MKKKSVLAELGFLRAKTGGRNVHAVANIVATIMAVCSSSEDDILPLFEDLVEKELANLRREVMS